MEDNTSPLNILIADDSKTNLVVLETLLRRLGHQVISAHDGLEALELYELHNPDLILLDVMMPGLDGYGTAKRMRELQQNHWKPIIFISALNDVEHLVEGLESGGDDYLFKPINFVILKAKLNSVTRALRMRDRMLEALERVRVISDNVMEAIITIDTSASIVSCNKQASEMFGWPVEKMIGKNVKMLMPEPYQSEHDHYVYSYVSGGPPNIIGRSREVRALRQDGSTFDAEICITEMRLDKTRFFVGTVRDITERIATQRLLEEKNQELSHYFAVSEAEKSLAASIVQKQLDREALRASGVKYWLSPTAHFSGDVVAATRLEDGRVIAMLADATGHGLAAAICALPLLTLFYRLTEDHQGSLLAIVSDLNKLLIDVLPVGRFVAVTFVAFNQSTQQGEIWLGGMPHSILLDRNGEVRTRFHADNLPLGVIPEVGNASPFTLEAGEHLVLYSDGLIEAEDHQQHQLGTAGLERILATSPNQSGEGRINWVRAALDRHTHGNPPHDDVSMLLIEA